MVNLNASPNNGINSGPRPQPLAPHHRVHLRGLALAGGEAPPEAPVIALPGLDGLGQVFADLCDPQRRAALLDQQLHPAANNPARLWQPLHRYQQIILLEAVCEHAHGVVPIDRRCIDSVGLCMRLRSEGHDWGWMRENGRTLGWQPVSSAVDPNAQQRALAQSSSTSRMQRLGLIPATAEYNEHITPLFVAPTDVCAACGTTVVCGILTTGSTDHAPRAERPAGLNPEFIGQNLPQFLRARPKSNFGLVGRPITRDNALQPDATLRRFLDGLGWVVGVAGLGSDNTHARAFADHLDQHEVGEEPWSEFLLRAHRFLLAGDLESAPGGILIIPDWPEPDRQFEQTCKQLAWDNVELRWEQIAPARGRFDDPRARYHLAPFIRLKSERGCPPRLVWATTTGPYSIVPWYEGSDVPPPIIDLPDPDDLSKVTPNAAFRVPPKLKEMMEKSGLKSLVEGSTPEGGGWDVMWICRIPIPIITIVAFFVFNIFLSICIMLFFWFSLVLKICIPIPIPAPAPEDDN